MTRACLASPPLHHRTLRQSDADPGRLPDSDEDVAFAPITRLSRWLARGGLSSRRLTDIYLARIEEYGDRLECFVTIVRRQII